MVRCKRIRKDSSYNNTPIRQPPPQALRFSHGEASAKRVTVDGPQGTMGRVQMAGEARLALCLLPAFLCAHIFIKREMSGYEAAHQDFKARAWSFEK